MVVLIWVCLTRRSLLSLTSQVYLAVPRLTITGRLMLKLLSRRPMISMGRPHTAHTSRLMVSIDSPHKARTSRLMASMDIPHTAHISRLILHPFLSSIMVHIRVSRERRSLSIQASLATQGLSNRVCLSPRCLSNWGCPAHLCQLRTEIMLTTERILITKSLFEINSTHRIRLRRLGKNWEVSNSRKIKPHHPVGITRGEEGNGEIKTQKIILRPRLKPKLKIQKPGVNPWILENRKMRLGDVMLAPGLVQGGINSNMTLFAFLETKASSSFFLAL